MSLACFMELASHEETFPETPTPSTRTGPRRAALRTDRARFMKNEDIKVNKYAIRSQTVLPRAPTAPGTKYL
jgi:hypothetical protein